MKRIMVLLSCCSVFACYAQSVDTLGRLAASYFKEAEIACKGQKLWDEKLYGPMLFVDGQSRVTYSNQPDSAGTFKQEGEIFKGVLPKDVTIANTSINWQGKSWSVILWPLPADRDERLNLMIHESFHRIQQGLGLPLNSPTAGHLGTLYGRIYFLLELQALKAALSEPVNERRKDLENALLFRKKRQQLFPGTFNNERLLEMNEGLAEYTGVLLGRQRDSILPHLYKEIDHAGEHKSLIRSFPYITGPVYGYLLYEKSPAWTLKIDSSADFPALVSAYYQVKMPEESPDDEINSAVNQYRGKSIINSEKLKEAAHLKLVKQYLDVFTRKPVLAIRLEKMNISFNPNNLFDLGKYGTVYPTCTIRDNWGQLEVSGYGMLMKDWMVISLPMAGVSPVTDHVAAGKGWKLMLNDNWKIVKVDALHYKLTK